MRDEAIRVLVADDHALVREGIRNALSAEHGFEMVAEVDDGSHVIEVAERHAPDVVLLDITMPGESGLEVAARLRRALPETKILILTMHDRGEYVLEAVRAGAHGYLLKDAGTEELREAIRTVHRGEEFLSPSVANRLSAALRVELAREHRKSLIEGLTARERQVFTLVVSGRTNKEIGRELGISPRTVESHRESLVRKLGIRTVAELTRFAMELGLIED